MFQYFLGKKLNFDQKMGQNGEKMAKSPKKLIELIGLEVSQLIGSAREPINYLNQLIEQALIIYKQYN